MNKERRKQLTRAHDMLEEIKGILSSVKEEEEESHANMPDSLQDSEKGEAMQNNIDTLDEILDNLESDQNSIMEIIEK